ncbi:hypothetical protein AAE478_005374 [Parahypoxylon ruwenzoriense]
MFWWSLIVPILGVAAVPAPQKLPTTPARPNPTACALISRAATSVLAANPSAIPAFPATVAFDCLRLVPNKPEPAQQLIQSLKAFGNWQSTLPWLKDPPESYTLPPVDIQGTLDQISTKAAAGDYESEYDFQRDILLGIAAAHDGHFSYIGDVFKAFSFQNDLAADIISVSANGTSQPKLYRLSALQSGTRARPVPISLINGQNATAVMLDLGARVGFFQDVDAQWNSMFRSYANPNGNNPFFFAPLFLGPTLTLTYENGDTETGNTRAILNQGVDFSNIASGDDYYDRFCTPTPARGPAQGSAPAPPQNTPSGLKPRAPALSEYPRPVVRNSNEGTTMGFFLDGPGFDDVAVLSISAFSEDNNPDYLTTFQDTVETFLGQSRSAGKQRLVIDLTANGGGQVLAGFELFAQLFPGVDAFNANNMRLADSLVNISHILASLPAQEQQNSVAVSPLLSNLSPIDLSTPQGDKFSTVDEILTPVTLRGDDFSAYMRQPEAVGFTLTGTGARSDPPPAAFKPEDIVILTDGTCGSTCTIFNVKTVSVGGAPHTGPMQSVGGVEGSQVLMFSEIAGISAAAINLVSDQAEVRQLATGELGVLAQGYAVQRALNPASPGSINFKNAFAPSDSQTPLQFTYEPANCRFFYTPAMVSSAELVWKYAVDATWTDPDIFCVQGSQVPVNTSKAVDPAFQIMNSGAKGGNGVGGSIPTEGTEDKDDDSAAGRGFELNNIVVSLLVATSVVALHL